MTDLVRVNGDAIVGLPVVLADGSRFVVPAYALVTGDGEAASDFGTSIGSTDDEAWDGVAADATVIALLKKIALNTEPAP